MGFKPETSIAEGLQQFADWYVCLLWKEVKKRVGLEVCFCYKRAQNLQLHMDFIGGKQWGIKQLRAKIQGFCEGACTMEKLLILANNTGGLYNFRKELIQELVKKYEVYVALPDGRYTSLLEREGCTFIDTPVNRRGSNPVTDLKLLWTYKNIIRDIRPAVVLTYTIKPNIYGGIASRLSHTPYLVNVTGLGTAVENAGILQNITLSLYKTALKKANCVFFQNSENKDFFIENKVVAENVKLIPGSGVNLNHFTFLPYPSNETTEFVFISRIMKEKGIDQYLEAATYIKNKYPDTTFHVCGFCEEAYESKLQELQDNGTIVYHGLVSDIREVLKQTHCTIHPSYYPEGLSNVLLESSACGRAIITTNRAGCREVVEDGVNGYVVEQKNAQDLIDKIENFLSLDYEEKRQMGIFGREKVEQEFDRQLVVNAYLEEINRIL